MLNRFMVKATTVLMVMGTASAAFAEGGATQAATSSWIFFAVAISCGLAIGIAALGTGLGMGNSVNAALTGIARNPEAAGTIMTNMIIGLALIESLCIYAFVISLLMVLKIPSFEVVMTAIAGH